MSSLVLQAELHNVRSQLLTDFSPDDMCPTSTQFFEAQINNPSSESQETDHHHEEVHMSGSCINRSLVSMLKEYVFNRLCWLTWGMIMMLLGKFQKAQKLVHLLYLHQIFWVLINFLKQYALHPRNSSFLTYFVCPWACMSGHLAWLRCSDKIFFHAFQVGADAAPQAGAAPLSADMAFRIWPATAKPWRSGNSRRCLPSWASSRACKRQACQAASPTTWSWLSSKTSSCLRYSTSHSQGHSLTESISKWT